MAVLTSEGRILFWEVEFHQVGMHGQDFNEDEAIPTMLTACPVKGMGVASVGPGGEEEEEEDEGIAGVTELGGLCLADTIAPHWFVPPEGEASMMSVHSTLSLSTIVLGCASVYGLLSVKLVLGNLWVGLPSTPTCVRMCPPLTTKNWLFYAPLAAIGVSNGSLIVYNLHFRVIVKELSVHSCPIR